MILNEKAIIIEFSISVYHTKKYFLTTKLAYFTYSQILSIGIYKIRKIKHSFGLVTNCLVTIEKINNCAEFWLCYINTTKTFLTYGKEGRKKANKA